MEGRRKGNLLFGSKPPQGPLIPVKPVVILLGFNKTIIAGNVHNEIIQAQRSFLLPSLPKTSCPATPSELEQLQIVEEKYWSFLNTHYFTNEESYKTWKTLITMFFTNNVKIAILSFTEFPFVIKRFLQEKLELPDTVLEQILIYSKCPNRPDQTDKTEYINWALKNFNLDTKSASVILVDAQQKNLMAGEKCGCVETILAQKDGLHLQQLQWAFLNYGIPSRRKISDAFLDESDNQVVYKPT